MATKKTAASAAKTDKTAKTTKTAAAKASTKKSTTQSTPKTSTKKTAKTTKTPAKKSLSKTIATPVERVKQNKTGAGFVDFLREQSVVGLAIGLIIGTQTKALADQLIASFINPLIGLLLPGKGALDQKVFVMHLEGKTATFTYGSFLAVLLSFITTAAVVYFVFKFLKLDRLTKKKEAEA